MISFKKNGLRILRNLLYRRYKKARRQFRKINRSFLRSITNNVNPIEEAPSITSRRTNDSWKYLQPVWVLSTGRTGTHTLAELLNLSPLLDARHEPAPELFAFSYDFYSGVIDRAQALQSLTYLRDELVFRSFRDGFIYVETNNRLAYLVDLLLELYPQSRFIFIHRNPYHFIRSGMRRAYYQGHLRDSARITPNQTDDYAARWDSLTNIEKIAWNWVTINEFCLNFIEQLPPQQKMSFSSKNLFAAEPALINRLFDFTGSPRYHPPGADIKRVMGKKHNVQKQGSFPKPDNWTETQITKVDAIIASVSRRLEYPLLTDKPEP